MIFVQRATEPKVLKKNKSKWLNKLQQVLADPASNQKVKDLAFNKYRHSEIKDSLKDMFHGKCAYCESKVTIVTYGDIEHFKPKFRYPDLTFTWENLLFSCTLCNDAEHKGVDFDYTLDGQPILIDPTDPTEHIEDHLDFIWDTNTDSAFVLAKDDRGRQIIDIFDLNGIRGRKDLREHRSRLVSYLYTCILKAQAGDPDFLNLVRKFQNSETEYLAFTRALCNRLNLNI